MKLNLGSGHAHFEGFVNVDMNPGVEPDIVCDVSNLNSYIADETVEEIVAYDVIEHFDRFQAIEVLKHWHRKLAPGGILQLRTNDIDRLVRLYTAHHFLKIHTSVDTEKFIWHMLCEHDKPGMGHKWGYTPESMIEAVTRAGFSSFRITPEIEMVHAQYPHAERGDNTNLHLVAWK